MLNSPAVIAAEPEINTRGVELVDANPMVVFDVDGNGTWELLLSDRYGKMGVFDAVTLKPLWEKQISEKAVSSPAVGNFSDSGALHLAIAGVDGKLRLLWPGTGEQAAEATIGVPVFLPPTVVPGKNGPSSIAVVDDGGSLRHFSYSGGKLAETFNIPNSLTGTGHGGFLHSVGKITRPPTSADIDNDGSAEILVGSESGTLQAIAVNNPTERYMFKVSQGAAIGTYIGVGDLLEGEKPNVVFGTGNDLLIVTHGAARQMDFVEAARPTVNGLAQGHVIVAPFSKDGPLGLIGASPNTVISLRAASFGNGTSFIPVLSWSNPAAPITPPSIVSLADGRNVAVVGDALGKIHVLEPSNSGDGAVYKGLPALSGFLPAGDLTGSGKLTVAFYDRKEREIGTAVLQEQVAKGAPATMTLGVDFSRTGQYTPELQQQIAALHERSSAAFGAALQDFEQAYSAKNNDAAKAAAIQLLGMKPHDERAMTAHDRIMGRVNFWRNLLIGLVAIVLVGTLGFAGWKAFQKKKESDRLKALGESTDYETALPELQRLYQARPQDPQLAIQLADLYVRSQQYGPAAIAPLVQARTLRPENSDYTLALAQAYAAQGAESEEALDVYLVAIGSMDSGRGPIAYRAGNALRSKGELDQAIKYYKLAMQEGYAEPELTHNLARAFIDRGQFSDKTLPVLAAASSANPNDVRLLEGLCRALLAARVSDHRAKRAACALSELRGDNQVAQRLLAKCELLAGNPNGAIQHAEAAYTAAQSDVDALVLLAQCYAAAHATEDRAVQVMKEAVGQLSGSEQADIVRALAQAYAVRGDSDNEAFQLMKRAAQANPQDEQIISGLAAAAESRKDSQTVIICLEQAVHLGRTTPEVYRKLASAYALSGSTTPLAERAYREALKLDSDDLLFLRALANALVQQDKMDTDAILLLEKLLQKEITSIEIGLHLARSYMRNSRYDDAVRLATALLQHAPEHDDLKKLLAQASLQTNRLDEAIRQYESLYRAHPEEKEAVLNLAEAYAHKQRTDEDAVSLYEKALTLDAERGMIRAMFARHHAAAGRFARGLEEYRRAIASDPKCSAAIRDDLRQHIAAAPDRTDTRWMLVDLLVEANQLTQAIEQLDGIFETDPSQLRQLLQTYDRILAMDPTNVLANQRKGVLLKAQGRYEEARPFLEKAHKANPSNVEAAEDLRDLYETLLNENDDVKTRFDLGKVHYALQNYDSAIAQFQKTSQDFRYENQSIKMLGQCFVGKGMLEFALQEFKKLVIDEDMKEILYDLAQRYEEKPDLVGAKQVYRELYRADINYRNVKQKFDMLAGNTSDPMALERTSLMTQLSEKARRRYTLVEELGRGAMGIVYKAQDNELEEFVALKILPDNLTQNPEAVQRFRSEARSARKLSHPNIVRIHDIGEELGRKYISMEFVAGGDLKHYFRKLKGGKLEPEEIVRLMIPVASAMDYAHTQQIVHRDLKPANILMDENGTPKVSDFGIAKMLEKTSETIVGAVIGTPLYMSPEQVQGLPVDNRADIYALGIMMYEFANGRPPFTEGDLAYQHINVQPKDIEGIPAALNEVIARCLQKDREKRWATAGELQKALEKIELQ